jgi:hypothetical protein
MSQVLDKLKKALGELPGEVVTFALVAVAVVVGLLILRRFLKRRAAQGPEGVVLQGIEVGKLGQEGPPRAGPTLECYNVTVRLAAVVVAPTGRVGELPPANELAGLLDFVIPGLADVIGAHRPLIRRWPSQLSAEGFARTVFANVELPGDRGKGTQWCSVAGRFKLKNQSFMAGLIMRAAKPNNFSETVIEKEHEWLGILRVRGE